MFETHVRNFCSEHNFKTYTRNPDSKHVLGPQLRNLCSNLQWNACSNLVLETSVRSHFRNVYLNLIFETYGPEISLVSWQISSPKLMFGTHIRNLCSKFNNAWWVHAVYHVWWSHDDLYDAWWLAKIIDDVTMFPWYKMIWGGTRWFVGRMIICCHGWCL